MDLYLIVYTARNGQRLTARVNAPSRQGAITIARTMKGAVGTVSAVKIATAPRPAWTTVYHNR